MCVSVVWVDHDKAKLLHFSEEGIKRELIVAGVEGATPTFSQELLERLSRSSSILILGPGNARTELLDCIVENSPGLARRVLCCEASERPDDRELAARAMKYFRKPIA